VDAPEAVLFDQVREHFPLAALQPAGQHRDQQWSHDVRRLFEDAGIRVVQTPYQAPNANAHAERFVRSITEECLDRIIPTGERHFRRAIAEFVAHDHHERNHQGLTTRSSMTAHASQTGGGFAAQAT
jgi:putative transposase